MCVYHLISTTVRSCNISKIWLESWGNDGPEIKVICCETPKSSRDKWIIKLSQTEILPIFCRYIDLLWLTRVIRMRKHMWKFSGVFMFTSVSSWLLLSISAIVDQWSNHSLFYKVCMMSVRENGSLYLACVMNQNVWFISLIEFGIAFVPNCWQDLLKFTWWLYFNPLVTIDAYKRHTDLWWFMCVLWANWTTHGCAIK